MVYNTSIDTKIFTFQLPGWCAGQLTKTSQCLFFHREEVILIISKIEIFTCRENSFRSRKPKIFYVSTHETSTTISTHTVCYKTSTAHTQCARKKRRYILFSYFPHSFDSSSRLTFKSDFLIANPRLVSSASSCLNPESNSSRF